MSTPSINEIEIVAVEGPTFGNRPSYPTLRVVDFQIIGEISKSSGTFDVSKTFACPLGRKSGVIKVASSDRGYLQYMRAHGIDPHAERARAYPFYRFSKLFRPYFRPDHDVRRQTKLDWRSLCI